MLPSLIKTGADPKNSVAIYDTLGTLLGRFPSNEGGYVFFMNPAVFRSWEWFHGVAVREVYNKYITVDVETPKALSTCYLTSQNFRAMEAIAKHSLEKGPNGKEEFTERFYLLAYDSEGAITVIDRSEEIDAFWPDAPQRMEHQVTVEAGKGTLDRFQAEQLTQPEESRLTVLAAGHTHPSEDGLARANTPSIMRPHSTPDYTPFTAKLGQPSGHAGTPAIIATEHGSTIYQTSAGQLDEYGHNVIGQHAGDRHGNHDVYDANARHIYKEMECADAPYIQGHLTEEQQAERRKLRSDMEAHRDGGGRL